MDAIVRGELGDPRVAASLITAVDLSPDFRSARVYLRAMSPEVEHGEPEELVKAMQNASKFLRSLLSKRLNLRQTPELRFLWDDSVDRAERIEELLASPRADDHS